MKRILLVFFLMAVLTAIAPCADLLAESQYTHPSGPCGSLDVKNGCFQVPPYYVIRIWPDEEGNWPIVHTENGQPVSKEFRYQVSSTGCRQGTILPLLYLDPVLPECGSPPAPVKNYVLSGAYPVPTSSAPCVNLLSGQELWSISGAKMACEWTTPIYVSIFTSPEIGFGPVSMGAGTSKTCQVQQILGPNCLLPESSKTCVTVTNTDGTQSLICYNSTTGAMISDTNLTTGATGQTVPKIYLCDDSGGSPLMKTCKQVVASSSADAIQIADAGCACCKCVYTLQPLTNTMMKTCAGCCCKNNAVPSGCTSTTTCP